MFKPQFSVYNEVKERKRERPGSLRSLCVSYWIRNRQTYAKSKERWIKMIVIQCIQRSEGLEVNLDDSSREIAVRHEVSSSSGRFERRRDGIRETESSQKKTRSEKLTNWKAKRWIGMLFNFHFLQFSIRPRNFYVIVVLHSILAPSPSSTVF